MVSYLDNPLMKTLLRYFLVASSLVFTIITLELVEADFWILCVAGLTLGLICLILEIVKVSPNVVAIIYEIVSVFAAIGFLSIFSGLIVDFIQFLAFYFSLDPVILNSILLSIGNNVGDYFGNGALAKCGEEVMGGFATYSGQIFNNFIGFSMGILASTKRKETEFDVFGLKKNVSPLPPKHYFLMFLVAFNAVLLGFTFFNLIVGGYSFTKKVGYTLLVIYTVYFFLALTFGILTRGD